MHNLLQAMEWSNQKFVGPASLWAGYAPDVLMIKTQKLPVIQLQEKEGWVGERRSSTNNATFFTYDSSLISPSIMNKLLCYTFQQLLMLWQ